MTPWLVVVSVALVACGGGSGAPDGGSGGSDAARPPGDPGPGLQIHLQDAHIESNGDASVTVVITDGAGVPLLDVGQDGGVMPSLVLAWLDEDPSGLPGQYTAYTVREQTSPITGVTALQAGADSGGTWTLLDAGRGRYRYAFGASAAGFAGVRTHTVAIWARRSFDGADHTAADVLHFRPDGADVSVVREVVTDETCAGCHGEVRAHGGQRQGVQQCILCHTPQTQDPDTGNTVDFEVMVHKIHAGHELPSVQAGGAYQIIGFQQSVHDYSDVRFPQDIRNCDACHAGGQGQLAYERPGLAACGACHDDVWFGDAPTPAAMRMHPGGPQADDAVCSVCHPAQGGLVGVRENHFTPQTDPGSPHVALQLVDVRDTAAGETPTLTFDVAVDGEPRDLVAEPLDGLRATFAGPTTEYSRYWQVTIQGAMAGGVLAPTDVPGRFEFTTDPAGALPADAAGSYSVGLEGYVQRDGVRFAARNPLLAFAVGAGAATPRRTIVSTERCDGCHRELEAHGGQRNDAQYCATCHNPENANDERTARLEAADVFVETVDLRSLVHRIHAGSFLTRPHVYGGFPAPSVDNPQGTPIDFSFVRFPRALTDCEACHEPGTWAIPDRAGLLPSRQEQRTCVEDPGADDDQLCDAESWLVEQTVLVPPIQSACLGCHDSAAAVAHAEIMTTDDGAESCALCHGPGEAQDVARVHFLE